MTVLVRRLSSLSIGALFSVLAVATVGAAGPAAYIVDGDGDGVSDEIDDCPYTPPGVQVNAKGCPLRVDDGDVDGVPDSIDDCPYTTPGAVVDAHGCALDDDFDGVANGIDRCPRTPLAALVDSRGCAKGERAEAAAVVASGKARGKPAVASAPPPVVVAETVVPAPAPVATPPVVPVPAPKVPSAGAAAASPVAAESPIASLHFDAGSERLSRGEVTLLQSYARVFARRLATDARSRLHLRAYADHRETNVAGLLAARAAVVRTALLAQGIAADRIVADSGVLRDGKAADNRRVEVKLGD